MEKILKNLERQIVPAKIFRDEILKLIKIVETFNPTDVIFSTGDEKFSIEEIKDNKLGDISKSPLHNMEIHFLIEDNNFISIDLFKDGTTINASKKTNNSISLVEQIGELLKSRRRLLSYIFITPYIRLKYVFMIFGAFIVVMYFIGFFSLFQYIPNYSGIIALIALIFVITVNSLLKLFYSNIIYLNKTKKDLPNWWLRNKDSFSVQMIVGIIILIIGLVFGYFIGKK